MRSSRFRARSRRNRPVLNARFPLIAPIGLEPPACGVDLTDDVNVEPAWIVAVVLAHALTPRLVILRTSLDPAATTQVERTDLEENGRSARDCDSNRNYTFTFAPAQWPPGSIASPSDHEERFSRTE